jgi:hypothetical protein
MSGFEAIEQRFQRWHLEASRRGEIQRVHEQHHVPLALEIIQRDGSTKLVGQGESRRLATDGDHDVSFREELGNTLNLFVFDYTVARRGAHRLGAVRKQSASGLPFEKDSGIL